jgi:hypothetical protein
MAENCNFAKVNTLSRKIKPRSGCFPEMGTYAVMGFFILSMRVQGTQVGNIG